MAAEVSKPDFSYQWSSGGAIVAPSDVKIQTGWTAEVPPFQWENFLQNRQDNAILHLFQKGISEWDALSNYYFTTSGVRSYVQGSDGVIYVAVADSVGQNPTTDLTDTYWKVAFVDGVSGDARYAQRANNLSDLASIATARTNLLIPAQPINKIVLTAGTTYNKPAGLKFAHVQVQAGGGGGGGANSTPANNANSATGGGGGGYAESMIPAASIGASVSVVVGTGGAGGTITGGNGQPGTASSFGSLVTAAAGLGGTGAVGSLTGVSRGTSGPGAGGTAVGDVVHNGATGGIGLVANNTSVGGSGGGSNFSAPTNGATEGTTGPAAISYGGGGPGAAEGGSVSTPTVGRIGGPGKPGIVIITEYF